MKSKKGALELSMNTIIIIVIGVVILSLGLMFVRGIFTSTTDLSEKVFGNANKELDTLGGDANNFLTVSPETVRLKGGQTSGFVIQVTNLDEGVTYEDLTGSLESTGQGVSCEFTDGTTDTDIRRLIPGAYDRINVFVKASKGSLGTKSCKFIVNNLPGDTIFDPEIEVTVVVS
ncbi:MAG: hypothetical protein V1663_03650 [archaeon]